MKILVIDDQPHNITSAHMTLKGYDYKAVDTIAAAYEILEGDENFDVVLTDLWMPRGSFTGAMHPSEDTKDSPIPVGLVFAIKAATKGMKAIICTDSDHHRDRLCSLLDLIRDGRGQSTMIRFVEARSCPVQGDWENGEIVPSRNYLKIDGHYVKNWLEAMQYVGLIPYEQ